MKDKVYFYRLLLGLVLVDLHSITDCLQLAISKGRKQFAHVHYWPLHLPTRGHHCAWFVSQKKMSHTFCTASVYSAHPSIVLSLYINVLIFYSLIGPISFYAYIFLFHCSFSAYNNQESIYIYRLYKYSWAENCGLKKWQDLILGARLTMGSR